MDHGGAKLTSRWPVLDRVETRATARIPKTRNKGTYGQVLQTIPQKTRVKQAAAYAGKKYDLGTTVRVRNPRADERGEFELIAYRPGAEELIARIHRDGRSIEVHPSRIVPVLQ